MQLNRLNVFISIIIFLFIDILDIGDDDAIQFITKGGTQRPPENCSKQMYAILPKLH